MLSEKGSRVDNSVEKRGNGALSDKILPNAGKSKGKNMFFILALIMFVALMQLIQKYYHIEKYLKFHKSYANSNDNLMKANLRKFKAGTMVVNRTSTFKEVVKAPKNPIVVILEKSGISITPELLNKISPFSQVQQMYGDKPIVLGLERCQEYRQKVDAADRLVGVAG